MVWREECGAVIPCLNEAATVLEVVSGVQRHVATVLVVDDGSSDATGNLAKEGGALLLRHPSTLGKGAALRTGLRHLAEQGMRWALTVDGDGQHAPVDIPAFFECAQRTGAALVIGNRMEQAGRMPFTRRVVNQWMSARLSKLAGTPLPDSQCGFRLLDLKAWASLPIETAHFEIESEVVFAFVRAGYGVEFVPIQVIYKNERSKIHPLWDTFRWLKWRRLVRRQLRGRR